MATLYWYFNANNVNFRADTYGSIIGLLHKGDLFNKNAPIYNSEMMSLSISNIEAFEDYVSWGTSEDKIL